MEKKLKRLTVYLDPQLHRALKIKSAQIERTMSEIIDDALRISFAKNYADLSAIEERINEPNLDFKDVIEDLIENGKL